MVSQVTTREATANSLSVLDSARLRLSSLVKNDCCPAPLWCHKHSVDHTNMNHDDQAAMSECQLHVCTCSTGMTATADDDYDDDEEDEECMLCG